MGDVYSPKAVIEIEKGFNKKFTFSSAPYQLPSPEAIFSEKRWEVDRLQSKKGIYNNTRSKLNHVFLKTWHKHTDYCNPAQRIFHTLQKLYQPEFLSQAWMKFYELLSSYPLIPDKAIQHSTLVSAHICEAPGGFVSALNHYLQSNLNVKWTWSANSLNPYYEGNSLFCMVSDDRLVKHAFNNWCFGSDYSGDILSKSNASSIVQEIKNRSADPVFLMTADGSIDCQSDPSQQEHIVSPLIHAEVMLALQILSEGGSLVVKMFTLFECESICLLYLLRCTFESLHVCKPISSKGGNSEVYVVCLGYKGSSFIESWLPNLLLGYDVDQGEKVMFPLSMIPDKFLQDCIDCAYYFADLQISVIEDNLSNYETGLNSKKMSCMNEAKTAIAAEYTSRCNISPNFKRIAPVTNVTLSTLSGVKRRENCTFSSWEVNNEKSLSYCLNDLKYCLKGHTEISPKVVSLRVFPVPKEDLVVTRGSPIKEIKSSKFCTGNIFKHKIKLRQFFKLLRSSAEERLNFFSSCASKPISRVCDVTENYRDETDYSVCKESAIPLILQHISELQTGDSFLLIGLPMWTQFDVGFVYLLSNIFSKVEILRPHVDCIAIYFQDFEPKLEIKDHLLSLTSKPLREIIALLPVGYILNPEFFLDIVSYNDAFLLTELIELYDLILSKKEEYRDVLLMY